MRNFRHLITVVMIAVVLPSCDSNNKNDRATPDNEFQGLRIIGDRESFTQSMREALLNQYTNYGYYGDGVAVPDSAPLAPQVDTVSTTGTPPQTDADSTADREFTVTNVQEIGVDESDRVKSDGNTLYVLNSFSQNWVGPVDVPAVDPLPVVQPEVEPVNAIAPYYPVSQTQIRILSLDSEAASATLVNELNLDTGNELAEGFYLHQGDGFGSLIVPSSSFGGYWGYWDTSSQFMGQQSTIRKIDVADPASAALTETLTFQGQIISSRRVGNYLYVASRFFPQLPGIEPYLTDETTTREAIISADIDDLLPTVTRASDNSTEVLVDANNCFVTEKPDSGHYSPDIITLAAIDLGSMSISDSVCYLGSTETLYASPESIYLATTQYNYRFFDSVAVEPVGNENLVPETDPRVNTDIHKFTIDDGQFNYVGSGTVDGHLGWNELQKPFRMSEKDGYLRVATYSDTQSDAVSPVFISILKPGNNGLLEVVARLPNSANPEHIGKPREQLHAARFLGDKAYLVTFLQTDPLYVVDLSNPEDPMVVGELQVDGYSDYLHPLDQDYLLGIGKAAIAAPDGGEGVIRGAFAQGVKISLFNVSDPENPIEVQTIEIGKRGTEAIALRDHHGITIQSATADHPTRLAFGIDVNDIPNSSSDGPAGWYEWRETGLHAFEIQTGNNAGITQHGSIIVETRTDEQIWGPLRYNDRSVIVDDAVFYIHGEQVYGANWNSLGNFSGPE